MTSITVDDKLLQDLKLVKRVLGAENMTDTIRFLMHARGYDKKWVKQMTELLGDMSK